MTFKSINPVNGKTGTVFLIKGSKSGITYLMTAGHVCWQTTKLLIQVGDRRIPRSILESEISTDLCILEGLPGMEGMTLAKKAPVFGAKMIQTGFPGGGELTTNVGTFSTEADLAVSYAFIKDETGQKECVNKGFTIMFDDDANGKQVMTCGRVIPSYEATFITIKGNSGSSVVNEAGEVVSVIWGSHLSTNKGLGVQYKYIQTFLSVY